VDTEVQTQDVKKKKLIFSCAEYVSVCVCVCVYIYGEQIIEKSKGEKAENGIKTRRN